MLGLVDDTDSNASIIPNNAYMIPLPSLSIGIHSQERSGSAFHHVLSAGVSGHLQETGVGAYIPHGARCT